MNAKPLLVGEGSVLALTELAAALRAGAAFSLAGRAAFLRAREALREVVASVLGVEALFAAHLNLRTMADLRRQLYEARVRAGHFGARAPAGEEDDPGENVVLDRIDIVERSLTQEERDLWESLAEVTFLPCTVGWHVPIASPGARATCAVCLALIDRKPGP